MRPTCHRPSGQLAIAGLLSLVEGDTTPAVYSVLLAKVQLTKQGSHFWLASKTIFPARMTSST